MSDSGDRPTTAFTTVLVYDGDCPFCSAAASALRRVEDVGVVAWNDPAAQAFLRAQFDDASFALFLADRERGTVYAGREAARELCDRAGLPVLVQDLVGENYESVTDAVRTVTGAPGDPDPHHGRYPLADRAAGAFDDLGAAARSATVHLAD